MKTDYRLTAVGSGFSETFSVGPCLGKEKSAGIFNKKEGRKDQELFLAVSEIGSGRLRRRTPIFSNQRAYSHKVRCPDVGAKMGIPGTVPSQVPDNVNVSFHIVSTFDNKTNIKNPIPSRASLPQCTLCANMFQ